MDLFFPEKQNSKNKRPNKIAIRIRGCIALALLRGDFPVNLRARAESLPPCQITITYVDISPDLRNATIYFTTSADATGDAALKFFEVQKYYLRNLIAKQIKLKFVPSISFKIDESVANAKKIENLLDPLRTSIVD